MILPNHKMLTMSCIGHAGLGRTGDDGVRRCIGEECIAYRYVTTYQGDIWQSSDPSEVAEQQRLSAICKEERVRAVKELGIVKDNPDQQVHGFTEEEWRLINTHAGYVAAQKASLDYSQSVWRKYMLGTCGLAGHTEKEIERRDAGDAYADS